MLEQLDIRDVEPYEVAPYEWVTGTARFAVDPAVAGNNRIVDLDRAPRDASGRVGFDADVRLLRPTGTGNGRLLFVVANRGATGGVPFSLDLPPAWGAGDQPHPGDGFLLERGWTIAWCGWQWDILRDTGGLGLTAPLAEVAPGWMRLEFRPDTLEDERPLSDSSPVFRFADYPTADVADPDATLTVRTSPMGDKEPVARHLWRFTDPSHVELEGGFQPFHWYELVYRTGHAPVVGAGLLAVRDLVAHLRPGFDHALAYGVSQSGRFLRQFLFEGLNVDEQGRKVFDGVFSHIASARRGEFNHRHAQPSLTHPLSPAYGPPYDTSGLLERQRSLGGVPKTFFTNSAWEYWRGDGALVHQDPVTGDDLPGDPDARSYLISGTDHMGAFAMKDWFPTANPVHRLDPTPILRALFAALDAWVCEGVEPPPSQVPRRGDGTAVERAEVLRRFPDAARPDERTLPWTPVIDPGSTTWPLELGERLVALVSDVDDDGNELAGIRLPAVAAPVAAFTGWNPRRPVDGLPEVLYEFVGSRLPLQSGRVVSDRVTYEATVRTAAIELVAARLLLEDDVDRTVAEAMDLFDQL